MDIRGWGPIRLFLLNFDTVELGVRVLVASIAEARDVSAPVFTEPVLSQFDYRQLNR